MGFFKNFTRGASNFFKKGGKVDGVKLFGKGSIASKGLGDVSKGLKQAGGVLGSVAKVAGTVLQNPLVQGGLAMIAPEALVAGDALTAGLQAGSGALKSGAVLTQQSGYRGNPSQVASNILEKATATATSAGVPVPTQMTSGGTTLNMM